MAVAFISMCARGDLEGVQAALKSGTDVNIRDDFGVTGLIRALWSRCTAVARLLLEQEGIDINIGDNLGRTALHSAALHAENSEVLAILLAHPELTTVNKRWTGGRTPLWMAVEGRAAGCVQMMISDPRTDPNIKNHRGNSPLMFAIKRNQLECVDLLLPNPRVDMSERDTYKRSEEEVKR